MRHCVRISKVSDEEWVVKICMANGNGEAGVRNSTFYFLDMRTLFGICIYHSLISKPHRIRIWLHIQDLPPYENGTDILDTAQGNFIGSSEVFVILHHPAVLQLSSLWIWPEETMAGTAEKKLPAREEQEHTCPYLPPTSIST